MSETLRHLARRQSDWTIDVLAESALSDDAAALVFDYLLGRSASRRVLDGSRSVVLPSPGTGIHGGIKIKGAGLSGSRVRLGTQHSKPYALPRYDAEGAATIDAAKDHGRAFAGGMSYQQARHEFTMSRYLATRGMRVFSPLGYGVIRSGPLSSWFCLLDVPCRQLRDWWQMTRNRADVERIAKGFGETQRTLADHDVYLTLSGMLELEGEFMRKDFHTAHLAGPNDSYLTRLSYYLFDTNFMLAQFSHDEHMPNIADHRHLAKSTYLAALTGEEHAPDEIDAFKRLLVELKYADWPMEQRLARVAGDPIGRLLLAMHLTASGEQPLFGELPSTTPTGVEPSVPRPGLFSWLRRRT